MRRNKNHKFSKLIFRHLRLKINKFENPTFTKIKIKKVFKKRSEEDNGRIWNGCRETVASTFSTTFSHFSSNYVEGENFLLPAQQLLPVSQLHHGEVVACFVSVFLFVAVVVVLLLLLLCVVVAYLRLSDKFLRFSLSQRTRQNHCTPPPSRPPLFFVHDLVHGDAQARRGCDGG